MSYIKAVFGRKFLSPVENGPKITKMAVLGVKGAYSLNFGFATIKKARSCAEPHLLTYFPSNCMRASWLKVVLRTQKIAQ